jgi:HD superfamily phosphohydrolase
MELRDPIHGTIYLAPEEVHLLDSVPYQRLRAIKQLGFAEFSFPGATHNRFLHSVGVAHLAGLAFDSIFKDFAFSGPKVRHRLRSCLRLAAYLHDIGHGPLSHTTEEVMPLLKELDIKAYSHGREPRKAYLNRQANHEDYTIKFITDSSLTPLLKSEFPDIAPLHVACLIDKSLSCPDDFFTEGGLDFRPILSQIVSSEMDMDRVDYLGRDAYFCGTNYGKIEVEWLISNLTYHIKEGRMYLALNRRALYTFDDFLLARHHMYLMVYFHHKAIIYEEFLNRYLTSPDCSFKLPSDIEAYIRCTDYALYEHLSKVDNEWAQRITRRETFKNLFELHSVRETQRPLKMKQALEAEGIRVIYSNSQARLSKYHTPSPEERSFQIFVVDQYDRRAKPYPIEDSTEIFQKYEEIRRIDRLYVAREDFDQAEKILIDRKL